MTADLNALNCFPCNIYSFQLLDKAQFVILHNGINESSINTDLFCEKYYCHYDLASLFFFFVSFSLLE